jgi:tetratricopeptide (TPR) repeat protein
MEIAARIAAAVEAEGGIVLGADPTPSGAKFLAAFGLDRAGEHDATRAALAALAITRELRRLPSELVWSLGLNAGTVLAADLGVRRRRDYTVLGDPINVAARLAAGAPAGQAVALAALEDELRPSIRLRRLPAIAAKGKSALLPRVQLLEQRGAPLPAVPSPLERIEGRDGEIARLHELQETAFAGQGGAAALLTGAAGTGKTALIGGVARSWEERGGRALPLALGRFDASLEPYGGWAPLLRELLGLRRAADQRGAIAEAVRRWQIDDPVAEALIARLARVSTPATVLDDMEPKLLRERLVRVICAAVWAAARERPLALIADGLERLDDASRDVFMALKQPRAGTPLLLLASSRRENFDGDWPVRIVLEGIDDRALELVVCVALGAAQLDQRVTAFLQSRTSGNPLFAITLAREALASGAIAVLPGTRNCVPVADLTTLAAPESLAGLLLSAIDGLDERDRRLVQAAAVCGQRFPLRLLAAAEPAMPDALRERAIDRLVRLDILVRGDDDIVRFRRPLQREAAYASLPSRRRRRMHQRIADALWADGSEVARRDLAAHLMAAGDTRLVPFALSAGEAAAGLADGDAALRAFRTITEGSARVREADRSTTLRALVAEGDALVHLASRYTVALRSYRRGLRLAQRLRARDDLSEGAIAFRIGYACRRLGESDAALRWLRRAARERAGAPPRVHAEALLEAASTVSLRGRTASALRLCAEALAVARAAGDETEVARCLDNRGTVLSGMGRLDEAIADQQESVAVSERLGNQAAQAKALTNLGAAYFRLARWDEAASAYRRARELRARLGDTDRTAQAGVNLGEVLAMRGEFAEALQLYAECRAVWERSGYAIGVAHARLFAGQALLRESRPEEAVDELTAAFAAFQTLRLNGLTIHAGDSLVEALRACGRRAAAAQIAAQVEEIGQTVESAMYAAFALRALATSRDDELAFDLLERAAEAFAGLGMAWERASTVERIAVRLTERGSPRAAARAEEARALFAALHATPDAARVEALMRRLEVGTH